MTVFTEQAIIEGFLELLDQKPLNKISVRDITEKCNINRNTFYYHFSSIAALIDTIIKRFVDELIQKYPTVESLEDCLIVAINFAREHKRAIRHIYDSASRSIFERHLWKICDYAVSSYMNNVASRSKFNQEELTTIKDFFKNECFGFTINWINEDMPSDVIDKIHRLYSVQKSGKYFAN